MLKILKNKAAITLIISGIFLIIVIPAILNLILFKNTGSKFVLQNTSNAWVGYIGSYVSSIIGGILSGGITLIGVLMTLNYSKKETYMQNLPNKLSQIDEILYFFGSFHNRYNPDDNLQSMKQINEIKYDIEQKYLRISGNVNLNTYNIISEFYKEVFDFVEDYLESENKSSFQLKYEDDETKDRIMMVKSQLLDIVRQLEKQKEDLAEELKKYI